MPIDAFEREPIKSKAFFVFSEERLLTLGALFSTVGDACGGALLLSCLS